MQHLPIKSIAAGWLLCCGAADAGQNQWRWLGEPAEPVVQKTAPATVTTAVAAVRQAEPPLTLPAPAPAPTQAAQAPAEQARPVVVAQQQVAPPSEQFQVTPYGKVEIEPRNVLASSIEEQPTYAALTHDAPATLMASGQPAMTDASPAATTNTGRWARNSSPEGSGFGLANLLTYDPFHRNSANVHDVGFAVQSQKEAASNEAGSELVQASACECAPYNCDECPAAPPCRPCCGPIWSAGVDAIFLDRSRPDDTTQLVRCNCPNGEVLFFSPDKYDTGIAAAPRFRLFRHQPGHAGLEVTYYNIDSWNDSRHFGGDITVLGTNIGTGTAIATYDSRLQNLSAAVVCDHNCWTKLVYGFRWISLEEESCVCGTGNLATINHAVRTTNDLYGGTIGFRRLLLDYGGCLTVDSALNSGVAGNNIGRRTLGYNDPPGDSSGVSYIGDLEFQANFEVTSCWTITAGYQLLWLTGLASAPEQYGTTGNNFINNGETVFFHGANVGVVLTF